MSYSTPPQWSHGNTPTAAAMNKYSDALNALYAIAGNAALNFATYQDRKNQPNAVNDSGFYFIHKQRWLWFRSTGQIEDPAGLNDDVSLSDNGTMTSYDLDTVDWLAYGALYRVTGCNFCCEDDDP